MVDLERRVGAVELRVGAAASLELVDALARHRSASDPLELGELLLGRQEILLLLFEKEGAMVETFDEVSLSGSLPLGCLGRLFFSEIVPMRL